MVTENIVHHNIMLNKMKRLEELSTQIEFDLYEMKRELNRLYAKWDKMYEEVAPNEFLKTVRRNNLKSLDGKIKMLEKEISIFGGLMEIIEEDLEDAEKEEDRIYSE
jgi:tRNA C32,U32 (ribose-2'-O)-methylase TrmJ